MEVLVLIRQRALRQKQLIEMTVLGYVEPLENEHILEISQGLPMQNWIQAKEIHLEILLTLLQNVDLMIGTMVTLFELG